MYLAIQNAGVAPVEAFTVLGVSTARGNKDKIGQFGSGGKHSINLLLRSGLNPVIYLGNKKLEFYTKPSFMGDKQYNLVCYSFDGQHGKTGFSLEFGELDWDSTEMALRELISNAIDAVGIKDVVLDVVDAPKGFGDMTSIYIQLTPEIQKYYSKISQKFLHFVGKNTETILQKHENTQARIYRKGVFVRSLPDTKAVSMFDYNFDDSVKIDETRNMDDYTCQSAAASIFGKNMECLKKYFKGITSDSPVWEDDFACWWYSASVAYDAWKDVHGESYFTDSKMIADLVSKQGKKVLMVRNYETLKVVMSSLDAMNSISKVESKGYKIQNPTSTTMKNAKKVWAMIVKCGLDAGKPMCDVKSFTSTVTAGQSMIRGYYENNCIYINIDDEGSLQTIMEEFAHYITGAADGTREFQEFAFNLATKAAFYQ